MRRSSDAVRAEPPAHIRCPRCGTTNGPGRFLCERCGAELETGRVATSRWAVHPVPVGGRRRTPLALRLAELVLAVAALVGGGFVLATQLGIGPFGTAGQAPDQPTFDPARYQGEPARLRVSDVAVGAARPDEKGDERGRRVIDGDLSTAWHASDADGPVLTLRLARPAWISRLVIRNGDQRDRRAFRGAARAKVVWLRLGARTVYEVSLKDRFGEQVVALPEPVLSAFVTLEFREVYGGNRGAALAVSELKLLGWVARDPA